MAHHRRKRPRIRTYSRKSCKATERDHPGSWLHHWPRWWDIIYHSRPRRRHEAAELCRVLELGDLEAGLWPLSKRPHTYYW